MQDVGARNHSKAMISRAGRNTWAGPQNWLLPKNRKSLVGVATTVGDLAISPSLQWASRFLHRHGWKSILSRRRDPSEVRDLMADEVRVFVDKVNRARKEYMLPPGQLWSFDETGIESGGVPRRTYVPPGSGDGSVVCDIPWWCDTLAMEASAAGETCSIYIEHQPAVGEQKAVKGM